MIGGEGGIATGIFPRQRRALIGLAWFFLWLLLVTKAYHHEMFKLPWIGDLAEEYMNR